MTGLDCFSLSAGLNKNASSMELSRFLAFIVLATSVAGNPVNSEHEGGLRHLSNMKPAQVFIGKAHGEILSCPFETLDDCQTFYADSYLREINDHVKFMTVYGEYLFAAFNETKKIVRCKLHEPNSCEDFDKFNSTISSMISGRGGHLFVGLWNGNVLKCSLEPNSCSFLYTLGERIIFLAELGNGGVYVAADSQIWRCSSYYCYTSMRKTMPNLTDLAVANNTLFGLSSDNKLWKCPVGYGEKQKAELARFFEVRGTTLESYDVFNCEGVELPGVGRHPRTMISFNGNLYITDHDSNQPIMSCRWGAAPECSKFLRNNGTQVVAFAYGTHQMKTRFRDEQTSCSWQGSKCPPFVSYYNATERKIFEVRVQDGKLCDLDAHPVDTTDADLGSTGPAAIFVMAPEGRLFLSKTHATHLLHTSSLLAGHPVSGAGEIVVEKGVIKHINNCSEHYEPTMSLNAQVTNSLLYQGYTAPIISKYCIKNLE